MATDLLGEPEARRKCLRLPYLGTVRWSDVEDTTSAQMSGQLTDISMKGCGVFSGDALDVGTLVKFELKSGAPNLLVLVGEAVVTRCIETDSAVSPYLLGFRFGTVDATDLMRHLMAAYAANPGERSCLCASVRFCTPQEQTGCDAATQGRNCWEVENPPCCPLPKERCLDCPYAVLCFISVPSARAEEPALDRD